VPPNIYIYIPHYNGLDQDYTVMPCISNTFESIMYETNRFIDFNYGRTIYAPGDKMPNLDISPFGINDAAGGGAAQCTSMTNDPWHSEIKTRMLSCIQNKESACIIPVTNKVGIEWKPMKENTAGRFKIKICKQTTLSELMMTLKSACPHSSFCKSTILMPLCCNAGVNNVTLTPTAIPITL